MANDSLARGAKSAVFGGPKVTQEKWDSIFGTAKEDLAKVKFIGPVVTERCAFTVPDKRYKKA